MYFLLIKNNRGFISLGIITNSETLLEGGNATCPRVSSPCLGRDLWNQAFRLRLSFFKIFWKRHSRCISDLASHYTRNNTCLRLCKANSLGLGIPSCNESVEPPQSEGEALGEVSSLSSWEGFYYWLGASPMLDFIMREKYEMEVYFVGCVTI